MGRNASSDTRSSHPRVTVDGKFFQLNRRKFHVKGLAYGPFALNPDGEPFPTPEQVRRDFLNIRELGATVLRVYEVPPRWFLDMAAEFELKLLIDIPWNRQQCFLSERVMMDSARDAVRAAVRSCLGHSAVFAYSVVNEIPPDIVRWSGARAISEFIDELIAIAKSVDPEALCTFSNYPPTEFLRPHHVDFFCFNVYLHHPRPFENYLARLQMLGETRPIILGETGIDTVREGEEAQARILSWQIEGAFRAGFAGVIVFSFTDDWHTGGRQVEDWKMGITDRHRSPKKAWREVQQRFLAAPYFELPQYPKVSVVVACYNGERTLKACLDSLERLNYPDYEVILVDDGSTDATQQIASLYKSIRYFRHRKNAGLSVARNTGIQEARGEIIAFTDADCRADTDWLYYLVNTLLTSSYVGVGGPNFLPPEDSFVAAAVMASPGGPAHVMLTDRVAEHIPGCNMAFYKWALDEIGGFDPVFRKAGDDVDICWRLQQRGYRIGFSAAGFVWHYRRSTIRDYLKQQKGYGEAEALLIRKHPEYFNSLGGSIWQGRIYSTAHVGIRLRRPIIYHGVFGSGFFQSIYADGSGSALAFFTSLEFLTLGVVPLMLLAISFGLFVHLAISAALLPLVISAIAAIQADLPRNKRRIWSRPLIALLFLLQPVIRGAARYQGTLTLRPGPLNSAKNLDFFNLKYQDRRLMEVHFWSPRNVERTAFLHRIIDELERNGWPHKVDAGWSPFDVEIWGNRWSRLQLLTVTEQLPQGACLLRCRLRTAWSLLAHIVFWTMCGAELLILGFLGRDYPWLWFMLLTIPGVAIGILQKQKDLKCMIAVFLDDAAKAFHFKNITFQTSAAAPPPGPGPGKTVVADSGKPAEQ